MTAPRTVTRPRFHWPELRVGATLDGSRIEAVGAMHALAYFGRGDYRVVPDRPIVCTENDVIAKVLRVHRCGTDVKIFQSGRPDQAEESLLEELAALIGSPHRGDSKHFLKYVLLLEAGEFDATFEDGLYADAAAAMDGSDESSRQAIRAGLKLHWGRVFGHETVVEIVRVGSRVAELTEGIGYAQGQKLGDDYLRFQIGERCTVQSRIARYRSPAGEAAHDPAARGVQLLGGNITDLAMNQGGAFAQYVRLRPEVIRSGSVLRVPAGIDTTSAALVEPLACLLDCFQKSTHELGQNDRGSILRQGVMPGGATLIIGSGSMAMMAGRLALSDDPLIRVGGAGRVVFAVRSEAKRELVMGVVNDSRVSCVVFERDEDLPPAVRSHFTGVDPEFGGFDDVILAAGGAATVGVAHQLLAPTGGRILTFAGTRGSVSLESGVWHYANAGVLGTSGCNTKMMEIALGMMARKTIDLQGLPGRIYTFSDLIAQGTAPFFLDQHLRPALDPNAGLPPVNW